MLKSVRRLIISGILLALTVGSYLLARNQPELWFSFYPQISKKLLSAIGAVTGIFPFCVWEILLAGIVVWGIVSLILSLKKKRIVTWLAGVLELASLLLFLFVAVWGLNHFGPTVSEKLDIDVREYSVEELEGAATYYASLASEYADKVARDTDGTVALPKFSDLAKQAADETAKMPQELFSSAAKTVKPLLSSRLFSYMGISGIFVDITAEANVNTETYPVSLPYTMCHEIAHSCAISAEDDANYCAFLVCENSEDVLFSYSGYYSAYIYCYNALYKKDAKRAAALRETCSERLLTDCSGAVAYYKQFEGQVQEVATKANDVYLKSFGETKGVQSYGAVTDLLIAHWLTLENG